MVVGSFVGCESVGLDSLLWAFGAERMVKKINYNKKYRLLQKLERDSRSRCLSQSTIRWLDLCDG